MIKIYAEILAMEDPIIERTRRGLVRQSDHGDREAYLTNMRILLTQLEKVGERIA